MADAIEKALKRLQHAAREPAPQKLSPLEGHMTFAHDGGWVTLYGKGQAAFGELDALLQGDLRFEYLDKGQRDAALQTFAASAARERGGNHVPTFLGEHAQEPLELNCSFTVEYLDVDQRRELFGATFIPTSEAQIPGLFTDATPRVDSVIEVPARGTNGLRMMERAKASAEHALRLLLGIVGERYRIVQNHKAFAFVDQLLGSSINFETAGSLHGGRRVWVLATLPDHVEVGGDAVRPYVLLMNSHDGSTAVIAATTPIRVVCQNTLNWGLQSARQKFSIRHTEAVTQRVHEARRVLDLSINCYKQFKSYGDELASERCTEPSSALSSRRSTPTGLPTR